MNEELEELVRKWIEIEKRIIDNADKIIEKSNNDFIKMVLTEIKMDSNKHLRILEFVMNAGDRKIGKEDVKALADLLSVHEKMEMEAIEIANKVLLKVKGEIGKILFHLLSEEWKHHELLRELLMLVYIQDEKYGYL
ncbi:hypothetical protein Ferp_0202 [Ferroglobus placidus DSM 10642]|uniref:Rubrerythrin diiron-binding domain-containing protein n=1 Tax=Ferroglobus placidus (strain DSM 10642 / AEDII12DO) TaxID=589924 RepID=D3S1T1_FERPA|nr:hypothetical protein [Ferroglobus placidus]ADC64388.1 hypothetical protein Ferp_0202 [Ferroglobus placidus DSM 10642]